MEIQKPVLRFGAVRGHSRLSHDEETKLAQQGTFSIQSELEALFELLLTKTYAEAVGRVDVFRLNSLIWVYLELEGSRVVKNIYIAATSIGLRSINQIADKAQLNASFVGRLFNLDPGGGWNRDQVLRISAAIELDPRVMLFSDLAALIKSEEDKYKK